MTKLATHTALGDRRRGRDRERRPTPAKYDVPPVVGRVTNWMRDGERRLSEALMPVALPILRTLLGVVFIWFGALKIAHASPVASMVAGTLPWGDPDVIVPALGVVEVALGAGLVCGVLLRVVLPLLVAHLSGTFLTFAMLPGLMFRHHDPLLLTQDGEFVMKNVVLISAALVLIAYSRRPGGRHRDTGASAGPM